MPFFYDQNLEDKNEMPSGSVQISGASPTSQPSGGTPQSGAQAQNKELNTGSGFQNLDKYLTTNDSNAFGKQVLGKVGSEVQNAQQNQNTAAQKFTNQVQESNKIPDSGQLNSAIANPTSTDPKEFQKWMTQSYSGPKSLAESPDAWNQYWSGTNKANTSSQLLGSEAGRFSLLDSYFGKPNYNFGEKSLDNLFVQQSGLGRDTRNLQNQATELKAQGNQQSQALQNQAAQRAGQVEQSRNDVNTAYTGAQTAAQKAVDDQLAQANADRLAQQNAVKANLGKGYVTQDQWKNLGLGDEFKNINYNDLDLSNYLSVNPELNKNQAATPEQRARLAALDQLSGNTQSYLGNAEDVTNPYSIDKDRLWQDISTSNSKIGQQGVQYQNIIKGLNTQELPIDVSTQQGKDFWSKVSPSTPPQDIVRQLDKDIATWSNSGVPKSTRDSAIASLQKTKAALAAYGNTAPGDALHPFLQVTPNDYSADYAPIAYGSLTSKKPGVR